MDQRIFYVEMHHTFPACSLHSLHGMDSVYMKREKRNTDVSGKLVKRLLHRIDTV